MGAGPLSYMGAESSQVHARPCLQKEGPHSVTVVKFPEAHRPKGALLSPISFVVVCCACFAFFAFFLPSLLLGCRLFPVGSSSVGVTTDRRRFGHRAPADVSVKTLPLRAEQKSDGEKSWSAVRWEAQTSLLSDPAPRGRSRVKMVRGPWQNSRSLALGTSRKACVSYRVS